MQRQPEQELQSALATGHEQRERPRRDHRAGEAQQLSASPDCVAFPIALCTEQSLEIKCYESAEPLAHREAYTGSDEHRAENCGAWRRSLRSGILFPKLRGKASATFSEHAHKLEKHKTQHQVHCLTLAQLARAEQRCAFKHRLCSQACSEVYASIWKHSTLYWTINIRSVRRAFIMAAW
jgi:hypothetical protein